MIISLYTLNQPTKQLYRFAQDKNVKQVMKFKGIIFDLDGTLAYTLEDIADSMNRILESKGYPTFAVEKYKGFIGRGIRNLVKSTLPIEERENNKIDELYSRMINDYRENCLIKTRLYEGMDEVIHNLNKDNYRLAVLSNKAHELTEKIVTSLCGTQTFSQVLGAHPSVPIKPDPTSASLIAKRWNIKPKKIAYIGDSGVDMITAIRASMYPIGVLWGYREEDELKNAGAKKTVKKPIDLLKFF